MRKRELRDIVKETISSALRETFGKTHLFEMATIGAQRWGNQMYSIQIHGASTADRNVPHIHIYLKNDHGKKMFNFEISLIDLVSKDEINLIYQLDRTRNVKHTNKNHCSWNGYSDIYNGLREYLFGDVQLPQYKNLCSDNLDAAIYAWNIETDMLKTLNGGNPMKEWLDERGIRILPGYRIYFEPK